MVKCAKVQGRRLKTAPRWKIPQEQRRRIQMVLPRESVMTQPLIAAAMGVSPSDIACFFSLRPSGRPWFIDEKSRIQVLDSTQPLLPMRPGQVEEHGTISRPRV